MVFAAKPQLALLGDPHAAGGLRGVAIFVFGHHGQLYFTSFTQLGLAQQQATAVAGATADFAKVFGLSFIVVAVETAHHALAAGGGNTRYGVDFNAHASLCLACQV